MVTIQEFARQFYSSEQLALGKRLRFAQGTLLTKTIGIARNGRYGSLYETRQLHLFLPVQQHSHTAMSLAISMNTVAALPAAMRHLIAELDPRLPIYGVS